MIANDKPLLVTTRNNYYFRDVPARYAETEFGGEFPISAGTTTQPLTFDH